MEGMGDGGVTGAGDKGGQSNGSSVTTASELGTSVDAKEEPEEGDESKARPVVDAAAAQELLDHPMVDVSGEAPRDCDKELEADDKSGKATKDKADVAMGVGAEVDDGIGEEEVVPVDLIAKESESVPVI